MASSYSNNTKKNIHKCILKVSTPPRNNIREFNYTNIETIDYKDF